MNTLLSYEIHEMPLEDLKEVSVLVTGIAPPLRQGAIASLESLKCKS